MAAQDEEGAEGAEGAGPLVPYRECAGARDEGAERVHAEASGRGGGREEEGGDSNFRWDKG